MNEMPSVAPTVLYDRMLENLIGSWERYATGSPGAAVHRMPGVAVAAFPVGPERAVYNNAVLARRLDALRAGAAIDTLERIYADAGIDGYAVWTHENDFVNVAELVAAGYHVETATRIMSMPLDAIALPRPVLRVTSTEWSDHVALLGLPDGLLTRVDPSSFHVRVAALDGVDVATAIAYEHGGDCGIYNVSTMPHARRRGLGTALTALLVHDARDRGCTTASLQSTEMAERVYANVGFRSLGRFVEYVR